MKSHLTDVFFPSCSRRVVCSGAAGLLLVTISSGIAQEFIGKSSLVAASTPKNQIVATVTKTGFSDSCELAVSPSGDYVYVANDKVYSRGFADPPTVINTATNTVIASITDKSTTNIGIAVTPDGSTGFVTNNFEFRVMEP